MRKTKYDMGLCTNCYSFTPELEILYFVCFRKCVVNYCITMISMSRIIMLPGSGRLSRLLPSSSSISMKMTQKFSVLSSSSNTIISDQVNNYMRPKPGHKLQFISPPKLVTARYFSSDPNDEPAYVSKQ